MNQLELCYQKDPEIVSREIAGEMILVPIRQNVGDLNCVYTLNETASRAWSLFDGQHTVKEIQDVIVTEFEVDETQARQDLIELIENLEAISAVVKV